MRKLVATSLAMFMVIALTGAAFAYIHGSSNLLTANSPGVILLDANGNQMTAS